MKSTNKLKASVLGMSMAAVLTASGCASRPNYAVLTINSEPQKARIYSDGDYMGVTPYELKYILDNSDYNRGEFSTKKLTIAKEGYLPTAKKLRLGVKDNWRNKDGRSFYYSELFLLEGDPRYNYNTNNSTTKIISEDSGLRELNNGADILYKLNLLKRLNR